MTALGLIAAERQRQIDAEGYTPEHDDKHIAGGLAMAAACYAAWDPAPDFCDVEEDYVEALWPFDGTIEDAVEGKDRLRQLAIAGALIVAEMERLQRAEAAE